MKAGLLPHLSKTVVAIYAEATPDETETRLQRGLRKQLPELSKTLGLVDSLTALRRSESTSPDRKVVIILDQFEQWLHAHRTDPDAELVKALRQCDGGRLQAIVMIRDDFAMAAARFMNAVDVPIVQGENFATLDLFEVDHAAKVLTKFGQAFGKLPANTENLSADEQRFVRDVATGLAQDGKVVSVRLALFSEMVKAKPWTPVVLQQVGGTQGIGVNFLEETFISPHANPRHRLHAIAARCVLKSLMPELDTDIKGHMRSHEDLLEATGYQERPKDFGELLRILDGELRLITPTDPEGHGSQSKGGTGTQYYQLTHDYLVPSLREWLTRKQRETRKGRAELKLAERASAWAAVRESKQLPTILEWLNIRALTDKRQWTDPQRAMLRRADGFHISRLTTAAVIVGLITATGLWTWNRIDRYQRGILAEKATEQEATRVEGLVGQLVSAAPARLTDIIKQLDADEKIAAPFLEDLLNIPAETPDARRTLLHVRLARVAQDKTLIQPLIDELLTDSQVAYVGPIRERLQPHASEITPTLWELLRDGKIEANRRFRTALALATIAPEADSSTWTEQDLRFMAEHLVGSNAETQPLLRDYLRPIRSSLLRDLELLFSDARASENRQVSAANALADFASNDIPRLAQLLVAASPEQYAILFPLVAASNH